MAKLHKRVATFLVLTITVFVFSQVWQEEESLLNTQYFRVPTTEQLSKFSEYLRGATKIFTKDKSTDETPTEETPTEETPTEETPTDETPTDETPTGETPTDETSTNEAAGKKLSYLNQGSKTIVYNMLKLYSKHDMTSGFKVMQQNATGVDKSKPQVTYWSDKFYSLVASDRRQSYRDIAAVYNSARIGRVAAEFANVPYSSSSHEPFQMYTFKQSTMDRENRVITVNSAGVPSMIYSYSCSPNGYLTDAAARLYVTKNHFPFVRSVPEKQQEIIVLSGDKVWGGGFWHYMAEQLSRLPSLWANGILDENDDVSKYRFHIFAPGLRRWVSFLTGATEAQMISGPVYEPATFHVGRVPTCGQLFSSDLLALRQKAWKKSGLLHEGKLILEDKPRTLLFVERRRSSRALYVDQFKTVLEQIAAKNNLILEVFTDIKSYTIPETVKMFARAKVIFGPHGAGLYNTFAAQSDICFLEILPDFHDTNVCYRDLAFLHGIKAYAGFVYNRKQELFSPMSEIVTALEKCLRF